MVHAAIHHQPVDPGVETRVAAEIADAGEQLQKSVLRDIHGGGVVAGKTKGDRVHLVFVLLEKNAEGVALPALTRLHELPFGPFRHHSRLRHPWTILPKKNFADFWGPVKRSRPERHYQVTSLSRARWRGGLSRS